MRRVGIFAAVWLMALAIVPALHAAEPAVEIDMGGQQRSFSRSALLGRPDLTTVEVANDRAYGGKARRYQAVPLLSLLAGLSAGPDDDVLEARASDGFVSQIPLDLINRARQGGAVPWIAVDDPASPWPAFPGKTESAGPFYLIWLGGQVGPEQWPYALAKITAAESPEHRWPQIAVDAGLPADHPARRGQAVFVATCLACHIIDGGGPARVGPDLNRPMNPTEYFTEAALRRLVRDPASVRTWPEQRMPAFDSTTLPDDDLDAVIAYLRHQAGRRPAH